MRGMENEVSINLQLCSHLKFKKKKKKVTHCFIKKIVCEPFNLYINSTSQ